MNLAELAAFATGIIGEIEHAKHSALEKVGQIVEEQVKEAIGTYDYGWPELALSTKDEREHKGFSPNDPLLRTGEQRDSYGHSVDGHVVRVGSPLDKALYSELGTSRAPPRPVLLESAIRRKDEILHEIGSHVIAKLEISQ